MTRAEAEVVWCFLLYLIEYPFIVWKMAVERNAGSTSAVFLGKPAAIVTFFHLLRCFFSVMESFRRQQKYVQVKCIQRLLSSRGEATNVPSVWQCLAIMEKSGQKWLPPPQIWTAKMTTVEMTSTLGLWLIGWSLMVSRKTNNLTGCSTCQSSKVQSASKRCRHLYTPVTLTTSMQSPSKNLKCFLVAYMYRQFFPLSTDRLESQRWLRGSHKDQHCPRTEFMYPGWLQPRQLPVPPVGCQCSWKARPYGSYGSE